MPSLKVQISAGELSGDMHGGKLVSALKNAVPIFMTDKSNSVEDPIFFGVGGENLEGAGVRIDHNFRSFGGVMGFGEVFKKLGAILAVKKDMIRRMETEKPDALVLIDFPDFNLRLAKAAHKRNIPVIYFIPPKVWAWRPGRISQLQDFCKKIICILPFERSFYAQRGVTSASFVGHPFCDESVFKKDISEEKKAVFQSMDLSTDKPTVVCLIGSRKSEVEKHFDIVLESLVLLKKRCTDLQAYFCLAPTITGITIPLEYRSWIKVTSHNSRTMMRMADVGIIKSGTSTLEAAFSKLPTVCIYKAPLLSYLAFRLFVKVSSVALPNLIVPNVMVELLQEACTPQSIAESVQTLLNETEKNNAKQALGAVIQRCTVEPDNANVLNQSYTAETAYDRAAYAIMRAIKEAYE